MSEKKNIPPAVIGAAQYFIDELGSTLKHLGINKGVSYYACIHPEGMDVGFPTVYKYSNKKVFEITGFEALDIINLFIED